MDGTDLKECSKVACSGVNIDMDFSYVFPYDEAYGCCILGLDRRIQDETTDICTWLSREWGLVREGIQDCISLHLLDVAVGDVMEYFASAAELLRTIS